MFHKNFLRISLSFVICVLMGCALIGCQPATRSEHEIYIGTISGPETDIMQTAKSVAKQKYGLDITIFEFEDYSMPNTALAEGAIDANMFQHQPYLDITNAQKNWDLAAIGKMYVYPMGIYSKKYTELAQLPEKAKIGIPNDPSNEARALKLLEKAGLITLQASDDMHLTPEKISQNPRQLKFQELTAAQLPRSLDDLDAACINTNYALTAGLSPTQDALFKEDKDSPYVNIVVVRGQEQNEEKYKLLMQALHSEEVQAKARALFGEYAIIGWE